MSEQRRPVEAIDRALALLDALATAGPKGATLQALAGATGSNKSTAYRALSSLRARDFATQDPVTGAYSLGAAALALSERFWDHENLRTLFNPALVALSSEVHELVHLGVLVSDHVLYLDKVEPERSIRVWSRIGQTVPAVTTALGRAILSYRGATRDQVGAYMDANPTAGIERVWSAIEEARTYGYAREHMENEPGISCVAFPLLREGYAIAALSVTVPVDRMTAARPQEIAHAVNRVVPPLLPSGITIAPL